MQGGAEPRGDSVPPEALGLGVSLLGGDKPDPRGTRLGGLFIVVVCHCFYVLFVVTCVLFVLIFLRYLSFLFVLSVSKSTMMQFIGGCGFSMTK